MSCSVRAFLQAELDRARRQALDRLSVALGDPGTLARMAADRAAFGAGAFGHSAEGTPASITRIKRTDVVSQHQAWYRPDNATLIFAGDIDAAQARTLARRRSARGPVPPRRFPPDAPTTRRRKRLRRW